MYIKSSSDLSFHLLMGAGGGSNNRVELLDIWGLLTFVKNQELHLDQIMGDSKTIVEWSCNRQSFQSISLHHWSLQVQKLIDDSLTLSIIHVYRELNTQADLLSKQAVGMDLGFIHWKEYNKDLLIQEGDMPCY